MTQHYKTSDNIFPEPGQKVLAYYKNTKNEYVTILAEYIKALTRDDSCGSDYEVDVDYDESSDTFYWKEGWYEKAETWPEISYVQIEDEQILYWQDLPTSPRDNS
jgi:hypothetical protein